MLIQVAQVCTWERLAIWWPSMVKRLILKPASSVMKLWWLAKLSSRSPLGWDILLDGGRNVNISDTSEIVAACKRLEKENLRWAWRELQQRFLAMQVDSALSATAIPFQATPQSSNEDDGQPVYPPRSGWSGSRPTPGLIPGSLRRGTPFNHPLSSSDDGASSDASNHDRPLCKRRGSRGSQKS